MLLNRIQSLLSRYTHKLFGQASFTRPARRSRSQEFGPAQSCECRMLLAAVNSAPVLANASNILYAKDNPATAIDSQITVSDKNNTTLASATITMTNFVSGQDVLSFTPVPATMGNITVSRNSGGILKLTSSGHKATVAQWQAALRDVKYRNSSSAPTTDTRNVTFVINDGSANSNSLASTINITLANPPVLSNPSDINYKENAAPVTINAAVTITDPNSTKLSIGMIRITNFVAGEDVLTFTPDAATMGNIAVVSNANGTLRLASLGITATVAQWQAAFRAVKYSNTSDAVTTTPRVVTFIANDGSADSRALTNTITVTAVKDAPVLANSSAAVFTKGDPPVIINPVITPSHPDNDKLETCTISITNYVAGQDVLSFTPFASTMGNIALVSNVGGVMVLKSTGRSATLTQWQSALRAVTYKNTSAAPTTTTRNVTFVANDGTLNSNVLTSTITVKLVNPPVLSNPATTPYNKSAPPVTINPGVVVTDPNSTTLLSATITITNYVAGEDLLSFTPDSSSMGNIALTSNAAGVMTLTSAGQQATLQEWEAAMRAVKYSNSSSSPTTTPRTITFVLNDGTANSAPLSNTINIKLVNSAPVLSNSGTADFKANGKAVAINTGIVIADDNDLTLATATIRITNYQAGEDVLNFSPLSSTMGNIVATSNADGTLTLSSAGRTATLAQWQAALRAVKYSNIGKTPITTPRSISIVVNDGTTNSNSLLNTVNVLLS